MFGWTLAVVKRTQLHHRFVVLPKRSIVERSFAWMGNNQRLSKDYEVTVKSSEAFVRIAFIRLMLNLQLHHVISGVTGLKIVRAIVAGERDPGVLAAMRDERCRESEKTIRAALVSNYQPEHVFALAQALDMYEVYQARIADCDNQIEKTLQMLCFGQARAARAFAQSAP